MALRKIETWMQYVVWMEDTEIKETNGAHVLCWMIAIKWLAISKMANFSTLEYIFHYFAPGLVPPA